MDALLEQIVRAPDDAQARLVWADAIGGERGELVALQCDLERGGHSPAESGKRRRRIHELVDAHGWEWSGLRGIATKVTFRRGFVDAVTVSPQEFVRRDLFEIAPLLQTAELTSFAQTRKLDGTVDGDDPVVALRAVLEHPSYRKLVGVCIDSIGVSIEVDSYSELPDWSSRYDEGLDIALELGAFENLRAARFDRCPTARMVEAGVWANVERAHMVPGFRDGSYVALFRSMPRLRALIDYRLEVEDVAKLPSGLTELYTSMQDEDALEALADSPVGATLEYLHLHHILVYRRPEVFEKFPRLRSLFLSDLRTGNDSKRMFERFGAVSLPHLRELHISGGLYPTGLQAIAAGLGPQLELFSVGSEIDLELVRPLVAGNVRVEVEPYYTPQLHAHSNRATGWDWPVLRSNRATLAR